MVRFLIRRIILVFLTLLVVSLAIFLVTEILPGDVATMILGQGATEENLAAVRAQLKLDRPAPVRYWDWMTGALRGDLGNSYVQRRPIVDIIRERLGNSALLALCALLVAVPLALIVGVWAGIRRDSWGDQTASILSLVAISLPEFVTGVILIVIFASTLHLLPSSSIMLPGTSPLTRPQVMVLPIVTLTAVLLAYIMRMTRSNVIEVMQSHYVRTAILKGLPMSRVILRHVLPNALLPTISVIGMNIGWMLGGLIIVESVFAYPGVGRLLLTSISSRDVPLLQAVALLIAATYAISNLLADISYSILNPRIRIS